jgi:uncharacterized Zn-binding protein involved in type VI secretion
MGKPAARLTDMTAHGGSVMGPGVPTVLIGKMPAATILDNHVCPMATPGVPPIPHVGGPMTLASTGVMLGKKPAGRMGDMHVCVGPPSTVVMGCFTVLIGEAGGGGGGGAGAAAAAAASNVTDPASVDPFPANSPDPGTETHFCSFRFTDSAGMPLAGIPYVFKGPDSIERHGASGPDGDGYYSGFAKSGSFSVKPRILKDAKWSKAKAPVGEEVELSVAAEGLDDGTEGELTILRKDDMGGQVFLARLPAKVQGKKMKAKWAIDVSESQDAPDAVKGNRGEEYCQFIAHAQGAVAVSGKLSVHAELEIEVVDEIGQPLAGAPVEVVLANGEVKKSKLDDKGSYKAEKVPANASDVALAPAPPKDAPQVTPATLEIWQICDKMPSVALGVLELEIEPGAESKFAWEKSDDFPFGIVKVNPNSIVTIKDFQRTLSPDWRLRSRGGRSWRADGLDPMARRGGYQFCPSDAPDGDLYGKAHINNEIDILSVKLQMVGFSKGLTLPLLFPKQTETWMWEETKIKLSFKLKAGGKDTEATGPEITLKAYPFIEDTGKGKAALEKSLAKEYGNPSAKPALHARDYIEYVDGSSELSRKFIEYLKLAATFINSKLKPTDGISVTPVEIGLTFLSEGGVLVLQGRRKETKNLEKIEFSGYQHLGIDSYVTRWKASSGRIREFTPTSLEKFISDGKNIDSITNERGDKFETFNILQFSDAVHAVASLYADAKFILATDMSDANVVGPWITIAKNLPQHVQYFWSTLYYNTGETNGRKAIAKNGIEYHDLNWRQKDDHTMYAGMEKYNANWRTASFRLAQALGSW